MIMVYDKIEKTETLGEVLGFVKNARMVCELNGKFHLTFLTDTAVKPWQMVKAKAPEGWQTFFISEVKKSDELYDVTCQHITFLLEHSLIPKVNISKKSAGEACKVLNQYISESPLKLPFLIQSNMDDETHSIEMEWASIGDIIANHLRVNWNAKLYRDNFTMTVAPYEGERTEVLLAERKNLLSFSQDKNIKDIATRLHLHKKLTLDSSEGDTEEVEIKTIVESPIIGKYPIVFEKSIEVNEEIVTSVAQLEEYGRKLFREGIDKPKESVEIRPSLELAEGVKLGQSAIIYYRDDDVYSYIDFVAYEYDPQAEEYITMSFGELPKTFERVVSKKIKRATKPVAEKTERYAREGRVERGKQNRRLRETNNSMKQGFSGMKSDMAQQKKEWKNEIKDTQKAISNATTELRSLIKQTAREIELSVSSLESSVSDTRRSVSRLSLRADRIESEVSDAKSTANGAYSLASTVKQTSDSWQIKFKNRVAGVENILGKYSMDQYGNIHTTGSILCDRLEVQGRINSMSTVSAYKFIDRRGDVRVK